MNVHSTYTETARWLHWLVVAAIILQYVLAELATQAADAGGVMRQLALLAHHKSVGMTILFLAILRIGWRWRHRPPPLPQGTPAWQHTIANLTHWALYALLLTLPITGWLMSSASAYSVSWFNLVQLPDLIGPSETHKALLQSIHEWLATSMFLLAVLHLGAALKHAFYDRDEVLKQMSSIWAVGAGLGILVAGWITLLPSSASSSKETSSTSPALTTDQVKEVTPMATDTSIDLWTIDYANSHIEFTAEQAGAPFTGRWQDWQAQIRFDPDRLAASSAQVAIQTAAVSTEDDDRDGTLRGSDFFDTANFPQATFSVAQFDLSGDGFVGRGQLEIKGLRLPLDFQFNISQTEGGITLKGSTRIDRLTFGIGTGDWEDPTWVGQFVDVNVLVKTVIE